MSEKKRARKDDDDGEGSGDELDPPSKTATTSATVDKSILGATYFDLGRLRYASISEFKGKTSVNIREMYLKDNKLMPGKKGINLSADEFEKLLAAAPTLKEKLKK